jgi:hypothetical protein
MAITIKETKRGVNWLIGNEKSRDKGEKRKAALYAFRHNSLLQQDFLKGGVGRICGGE